MPTSTCAASVPGAIDGHEPSQHSPRMVPVRVDRIRAELAQLGSDERAIALWGQISLPLVNAVLGSGRANRVTLRRIKRGLRLAWTDKLGVTRDQAAWSRITMRYLSDEIQ